MRMRHSRNSRNLIPAKYPKNWPSRNSRNFGPAKIKALKVDGSEISNVKALEKYAALITER